MKRKNLDKKHRLLVLSLVGLFLCVMIGIVILMSSSNCKTRFFGSVIGTVFMVLVMLVLGIVQFIPRIFRGRKTLKLVFMWVLGALWIFISMLLITGLLPDYLNDIPYVVNSNYSSSEGVLTAFYVSHGKSTRTYLTIDNNKFDISGEYKSDFLIKGRRYRIEYLPNSKFVMHIYRYRK